MQRIRAILLCVILAGLPLMGFSAEATAPAASAAHEEGLPPGAGEVFRVGGLPVVVHAPIW